MTRAMKRLYCLYHKQAFHPFVADIASCSQQFVSSEKRVTDVTPEDIHAYNTILWELELSDVIISFPAYKGIINNSQAILTRLKPGESEGLRLKKQGKHYTIFCHQYPIARLSARGANYYVAQLSQGYVVDELLFLASIKWDGRERAEEFSHLTEIDTWYTGLYQVIFAKGD